MCPDFPLYPAGIPEKRQLAYSADRCHPAQELGRRPQFVAEVNGIIHAERGAKRGEQLETDDTNQRGVGKYLAVRNFFFFLPLARNRFGKQLQDTGGAVQQRHHPINFPVIVANQNTRKHSADSIAESAAQADITVVPAAFVHQFKRVALLKRIGRLEKELIQDHAERKPICGSGNIKGDANQRVCK